MLTGFSLSIKAPLFIALSLLFFPLIEKNSWSLNRIPSPLNLILGQEGRKGIGGRIGGDFSKAVSYLS